MKRDPPPSHPVPADTRRTSRGLHVPIGRDLLAVTDSPPVLRSVLFVAYHPDRTQPAARPVGTAELAARLYPNVLNALAHEDHGLPAVTRLADGLHACRLESAALGPTCRLAADLCERAGCRQGVRQAAPGDIFGTVPRRPGARLPPP